jgi:hypothetical protein
MGIFYEILILVASYLITAAMKPKARKAPDAVAALDSDFTFPQADEGTPEAVIFGEAWLPNWSVVWHGNYRGTPYQQQGTTIGYYYAFTMLMGLCRGPIDEVVEIDVGGRVVKKPSVDGSSVMDHSTTFFLDRSDLFGAAPNGSGGIQGNAYLLMGDSTQTLPASINCRNIGNNNYDTRNLSDLMPGPLPAFRGVTTVIYDGMVSFNQPNPQPWTFRVRRALKGWQDDAPFYPAKAVITVSSGVVTIPNPQLADPNISDDDKRKLARTVDVIETIKGMNPAHVLYEGITNRAWGRGLPSTLLNVASFTDAADILYDEGMAVATKWDRTGTLSDFMQTILDYIGASLYPDPTTGNLTLHLVRGDYDVNAIPTFTYTSGLLRVTDNSAGTGDAALNQIIVSYTSPVTGKTGQIRAQNIALIQSNSGAVFSDTKKYDCCPNADIAARIARRDLKAVSSGLRRLTVQLDRSAWKAAIPGGVIRIQNVTDNKIDDMVLRIAKVKFAGGTDGTIELTTTQDVFALNTTAYHYTIDTPPSWKPPVPSDTIKQTPPPLISNLRLAKPWDGNQFIVTWDRGADAAHYDIQIIAGNPSKVVRFSGNSAQNTYTYSIQQMLEDGGPWRTVQFQVRAVSSLGVVGPFYNLNLGNPQIVALTGIQIAEAMKQAFFQCDRPAEGDWQGIQVFISDTKGFAPDPGSNLVYDGPNLFVTLTQLADGTLLDPTKDYYLRAAGYDTFGADSLNYSSELVFSVVAMAPDAGTIVAGMIADGALDISKFARTIQPPLIVNGVPTAYAGSDVVLNSKDNLLYRWDATNLKYTAAVPAATIDGTIAINNIPQIPTTQLTGQISAAQIQANAVGANQIAANAITAGKIAAGAVLAGTIAAGAVGANEIAAHSISSDKLLVGDMTNQVDDPSFDLGDLRSWTADAAGIWRVDATTPGLGADGGTGVGIAQSFGGAGIVNYTLYNSRVMKATMGDIWYATAQLHLNVADAKAAAAIGVVAKDVNGNVISWNKGNNVQTTAYSASSVQVTVNNPAIATLQFYCLIQNLGGANVSTTATYDQCQMLRMSGTTLIQDGSVTTQKVVAAAITVDKLAVNSVTADKIVANSITGDKIAANAITANLIAAGSISADKLQVGGNPNLLPNPGWSNGVYSFWNAPYNLLNGFSQTVSNSNEWTAVLTCATANVEGTFDSYAVPVTAGQYYMASIYGVSGVNMYLRLYFLNSSGQSIGYYTAQFQGGNAGSMATMTRVFVKAIAPAGAVAAVVGIGVNAGYNLGGWAYRPMLEECLPNQVGPSAWGSGINTVIGPGMIRTGSLSAITANLGAINAGSLNINGLFVVNSDGTTTIQSATSGQRSVLQGGTFLAYDGNNTLRFRAGVW